MKLTQLLLQSLFTPGALCEQHWAQHTNWVQREFQLKTEKQKVIKFVCPISSRNAVFKPVFRVGSTQWPQKQKAAASLRPERCSRRLRARWKEEPRLHHTVWCCVPALFFSTYGLHNQTQTDRRRLLSSSQQWWLKGEWMAVNLFSGFGRMTRISFLTTLLNCRMCHFYLSARLRAFCPVWTQSGEP